MGPVVCITFKTVFKLSYLIFFFLQLFTEQVSILFNLQKLVFLSLKLASDKFFVLVLATNFVLERVFEIHVLLSLLQQKLNTLETLLDLSLRAALEITTVRGAKGLQTELHLFNFKRKWVIHAKELV